MMRPGGQLSMKGILVPVDWDSEGNAIKAAIFTTDEGEYLIEEMSEMKGLLALVRQEVEVRGVLREEAGQKVLTVENYRQTRGLSPLTDTERDAKPKKSMV